MKKIIPFNNIVLAKLLDKERESKIYLPEEKKGRFIRIQIIAKGKLVEDMKVGDVVIANNMLETVDLAIPDIGFINSKDILGKEINGPAES